MELQEPGCVLATMVACQIGLTPQPPGHLGSNPLRGGVDRMYVAPPLSWLAGLRWLRVSTKPGAGQAAITTATVVPFLLMGMSISADMNRNKRNVNN
jgi:hypothetical protein